MRSAMATKPCVVCGDTQRAFAFDLREWAIGRCAGCGTHTLHPEPDHVQMEEFNDGSGYAETFSFRDELCVRYDTSLAYVECHVAPGRLLDVGCGPGFLLDVAAARGWTPVGVDPSPYAVGLARDAGYDAYEGMLEGIPLEAGSFDAVALLQVVEHIPDPRPLLRTCRALLRPGGALLVATPNPVSLLARATRERFNYWIPPIHCTWYTPSSLSRLLRSCGFAPVREATWSARTDKLDDGVSALSATRIGKVLPYRAKRALGRAAGAAADALGYGTIVEHVALRWENT